MGFIEIRWFEEGNPVLIVVPWKYGHRLALLHDVWPQLPHSHQINFEAVDCNEAAPVQMAVILEQLLLKLDPRLEGKSWIRA